MKLKTIGTVGKDLTYCRWDCWTVANSWHKYCNVHSEKLSGNVLGFHNVRLNSQDTTQSILGAHLCWQQSGLCNGSNRNSLRLSQLTGCWGRMLLLPSWTIQDIFLCSNFSPNLSLQKLVAQNTSIVWYARRLLILYLFLVHLDFRYTVLFTSDKLLCIQDWNHVCTLLWHVCSMLTYRSQYISLNGNALRFLVWFTKRSVKYVMSSICRIILYAAFTEIM